MLASPSHGGRRRGGRQTVPHSDLPEAGPRVMITVAPSSGGSGPPGTPKQWQCALQYGNRYRPGPGPCTPTGRKPPQRQARIASHRSAILLPSPSHKPVLSSAQTGVPRPQARGPLPPPLPIQARGLAPRVCDPGGVHEPGVRVAADGPGRPRRQREVALQAALHPPGLRGEPPVPRASPPGLVCPARGHGHPLIFPHRLLASGCRDAG